MENWFEFIDSTFTSEEFIEKVKEDSAHKAKPCEKRPATLRDHPRIRTRKFKQAMFRRFTSVHPDLDLPNVPLGTQFCSCDGGHWKYKEASFCNRGGMRVGSKRNQLVDKLTSRRIRHAPLYAAKYSQYKKMYAPHVASIW